MSFSAEQKKHIIEDQNKNACCRRAMLCGILSTKAEANSDKISFNLETLEYASFAVRLISEFYGRDAQISSLPTGGRCKSISFFSKSASKYLASVNNGEDVFSEKCQFCAASFFKGVFLACGNFSDPQKQYLLELSPKYNFEKIYEKLIELGFEPKISSRRGERIIYIKKASQIEDFSGFLGLTGAMFEIANTQIKREFLNNTNRIVNCETNNIGKSVSASGKYIAAIKALSEHNLLSNLSEELEYTARLRMQNESLSLSQLSKLFTPPISKSGLSHRLNKILEIANQLLAINK